jgi:hypothetical protein
VNPELSERACTLLSRIMQAWKDVPKPLNKVADSGCLEDVEINALFLGRDFEDIDLESRNLREASPLIYMSIEARKYYLQSYFRHCLSVDNKSDNCCTPCMGLISELSGKSIIKERKYYNTQQKKSIVEFLSFVESNSSFFGESDRVKTLRKAILGWSKEIE